MSERMCEDCKYASKSIHEQPCRDCLIHQNWHKNNWSSKGNKCCSSCKHINTDMKEEPCAACNNYSNWELEKESGELERNMREYEAHIRQNQRDIDNFVADLKQARESIAEPDEINHPAHYTQGGIECIDAIEAALTPEEFRGYLKGNCLKYIWRERGKGGNKDIEKAEWYIRRLLGDV